MKKIVLITGSFIALGLGSCSLTPTETKTKIIYVPVPNKVEVKTNAVPATEENTNGIDTLRYYKQRGDVSADIKVAISRTATPLEINCIAKQLDYKKGANIKDRDGLRKLIINNGKEIMIEGKKEGCPHEKNMRCPYNIIRRIEWVEETKSYLTIHFNDYYDTGGAHGMGVSGGITYDKNNGEVLDMNMISDTTSKIFKKALIKETVNCLHKDFPEITKPKDVKRLMFNPKFGRYFLPTPLNCYLRNDSVVFNYSEYEILPYCFGSLDIPVSIYDLAPVLTDKAKEIINNR